MRPWMNRAARMSVQVVFTSAWRMIMGLLCCESTGTRTCLTLGRISRREARDRHQPPRNTMVMSKRCALAGDSQRARVLQGRESAAWFVQQAEPVRRRGHPAERARPMRAGHYDSWRDKPSHAWPKGLLNGGVFPGGGGEFSDGRSRTDG
jgi:hypothetical protein